MNFFDISTLPKVVRTWCALYSLTSKCASHHNAVHLFDSSTLPKVLQTWCALHMLTSKCMCFGQQRRALFSTCRLPKVLRACGVFSILASKCASRPNAVHFFNISSSKSAPMSVCFLRVYLEMRFARQRRAIFHLSSGQMAPHPPL